MNSDGAVRTALMALATCLDIVDSCSSGCGSLGRAIGREGSCVRVGGEES